MPSKRVQVVLPDDEAAEWEMRAKNAGLSVSSWVARQVRAAMESEAHEKFHRRLRSHEATLQAHEERITRLEGRITRVEGGEVNTDE